MAVLNVLPYLLVLVQNPVVIGQQHPLSLVRGTANEKISKVVS